MKRRLKLTIEYSGAAYSGWQRQTNGIAIQQVIEEAIRKLTGEETTIHGAGRTDAGVHALGQVAHFDTDSELDVERFLPGINYFLPKDIRINRCELVSDNFHSRFQASSRRYRYLMSPSQSALYGQLRWEGIPAVEFPILQQAASLLIGSHDFSAFCVVASRQESNICEVQFAKWFRHGDLLSFEIRANRFLHSMIRSLVGSMANLAQTVPSTRPDSLTLELFADMLRHPAGRRVVFMAPPQGLYLVHVHYDESARMA